MRDTRIAVVQGRWAGKLEDTLGLYRQLISLAAGEGPQIVCLPEFTLLPYFPQTTDEHGFSWAEPMVTGPSGKFFSQMAQAHQVTVIGSFYERADNGYWNTAVTFDPSGKLKHASRKIHIPSSTGYHESTFFSGGDEYSTYQHEYVRLAIPTCYDQWFPEVARIHALNGAELIHYPTAIGSELSAPDFDSSEAWQTVMRGHAISNGVYITAANRVGEEGAVRFYGSSFICGPTGTVIASANRKDECFLIADLKAEVLNQWRSLFPLRQHRRPETYGRIVSIDEQ